MSVKENLFQSSAFFMEKSRIRLRKSRLFCFKNIYTSTKSYSLEPKPKAAAASMV